MSLLLETILYQDGHLQHLDWHNERLNRTRLELFNQKETWDLATIFTKWLLHNPIEAYDNKETSFYYRLRVLYTEGGIRSIELVKTPKRSIKTIQLVKDDTLEYAYKWADRTALQSHFNRLKADDMLIVKNGYLTDTFTANIILGDGKQWITPATPLLKGTKRAQLLAHNHIKEDKLKVSDLKYFKELRLINATMDICNSPRLPIKSIIT